MKKIMKKINFLIVIIVILGLILAGLFYLYSRSNMTGNFPSDFTGDTATTESTYTLSGQVESELVENKELHATYDLDEVYVSTNEQLEKGDKILKYENGKYLKAPYDCIIVELNVPDEGEQCTNEHYVQIASIDVLQVELSVDESKISDFTIGDQATVNITALDEDYEGFISSISSQGNNGAFTVIVEFINDSNVYVGMSAEVSF